MKKKTALQLVFVSLFLLHFARAALVINEFESNPPGVNSNNQWIELYNTNQSSQDISGWQIYDTNGTGAGLRLTFPNETFIAAEGFLAVNLSGSFLTNSGEILSLRNQIGTVIDQTPELADNFNDNRSWSRVPDGTGAFVFQESTRGLTNGASPSGNSTNQSAVFVNISDSNVNPSCLIEKTNATISSFINGSVQSVVLALNYNGSWQNFSLSAPLQGSYQFVVPSGFLVGGNTLRWQFIVKNTLNETLFGAVETLPVHESTKLYTTPSLPDGLNGWFVSEPQFTLANDDAHKIYYQWDSQQIREYLGSFGLENAPNNANITGGINDLKFWSDVCASENRQNETLQKAVIKVDLANPSLTNIIPANGASLFSHDVLISALIDEVYSGNSGIDLSTVRFYFDGAQKNPNITLSGIDAALSYFASGLESGAHHVSVSAYDRAGRFAERNWTFFVTGLENFSMTIDSPINKIYQTRRVPVNLTLSREAKEIQYSETKSDGTENFRTLCRNCAEFGSSSKKLITVNEGAVTLKFRAVTSLGETSEQNLSFLVDTKIPKITQTSPKKGFASGIFTVEITEDNPSALNLFIEGNNTTKNYTLNLSSCVLQDGKSLCTIEVNLAEFEGRTIFYWFRLQDILGNYAESKKIKLTVDTLPPVMTSFGYNPLSSGRVFFSIGISDANFNSIYYIDREENVPRQRTLCSRLDVNSLCEKTISLSRRAHTLDIFASDKAGNTVQVADDLEIFIN